MTCDHCRKPTAGAHLCDDCCKTLAYALVNVAAYYDDLPTIAGKQARYGSQLATKGSVGKEQPLVVDMRFVNVPDAQAEGGGGHATLAPATQVRYDTWATVVAWAKVLMEEQPEVPGPACRECLHLSCAQIRRRRWPRNTIRSMVAYFDRQWRYVARAEWAGEFLDQMLDCETRMRKLVDRPADRWYAGKCSASDESGNACPTELYALEGKPTITCPTCQAQHDVTKRRDFLLREAKDYLVTATEAAGALLSWTDYDGTETNLIKRIGKWRERGRLADHGSEVVNGKARPLYRLGDVQELLIEHAQREQARLVGS